MRILVLEDTISTRALIEKRLVEEGHQVDTAANGHQGFQRATSHRYDVVISDVVAPGWEGVKFIEAVRLVCPYLPIIIIASADMERDVVVRIAGLKNVWALLARPVHFESLFAVLVSIQKQRRIGIGKKTGIVCTIGPASADVHTISQMMRHGMDVARLDFAHGSHEQHEAALRAVREAEEKLKKPIAVLQQLCGPKILTGPMLDGAVLLEAGKRLVIQKHEVLGNAETISTIVPEIIDDLKVGDPVFFDDGLLEVKVVGVSPYEAICEVVIGGELRSGKSIHVPGTSLSLPSITRKDRRDLEWALTQEIDYVAVSFVRSADTIREIKDDIAAAGNRTMRVIAIIEKPEAINNIQEIIEAADGIMIARDGLGVELLAARVVRMQREIIRLCRRLHTPVVVATQMLDSMTTNLRPTRAEVADVTMAIHDGADALVLDLETAEGIDPEHVVETVASIIHEEQYEVQLAEKRYLPSTESVHARNPARLTHYGGIAAAIMVDSAGVLGKKLSRWSQMAPVILVSSSLQAARHARLYGNTTPIITEAGADRHAVIFHAMECAVDMGIVREGDLIAVIENGERGLIDLKQQGAVRLLRVPAPIGNQ